MIKCLGEAHEDVEPPHRLKPAGRIRDEFNVVRHNYPTHLPLAHGRAAVPNASVDAVEVHFDLVAEVGREAIALPVRRAKSDRGGIQIEQQRRVAKPCPCSLLGGRRLLRSEVHVGADGVVEVFQVRHDRAAVKLLQRHRRHEPRVGHNQIRADVRTRRKNLGSRTGLVGNVFKATGVEVRVLGGAPCVLVANALHARNGLRAAAMAERNFPVRERQ